MTPEQIKAALQAVVEDVKAVDVKIGHALEVFAEHIVALGGGVPVRPVQSTQSAAPVQSEQSTQPASVVAPTPAVKGDTKNGN
jgi:hypothetical protein